MVRKLAVRFSPSLSISFTGFSTPKHRLAAAPPLTAVSSAPPALARAAALDRLLCDSFMTLLSSVTTVFCVLQIFSVSP